MLLSFRLREVNSVFFVGSKYPDYFLATFLMQRSSIFLTLCRYRFLFFKLHAVQLCIQPI